MEANAHAKKEHEKRHENDDQKVEHHNAKLSIFLGELEKRASKYVPKLIVIVRVLPSTEPAPLVAAEIASHVIAAIILLYFYLTFRAF